MPCHNAIATDTVRLMDRILFNYYHHPVVRCEELVLSTSFFHNVDILSCYPSDTHTHTHTPPGSSPKQHALCRIKEHSHWTRRRASARADARRRASTSVSARRRASKSESKSMETVFCIHTDARRRASV